MSCGTQKEAKEADEARRGNVFQKRAFSAQVLLTMNERMNRQRSDTAREFREGVFPLIQQMRQSGMTLRAIADALNTRGIQSQNRCQWHAEAVRLVLASTSTHENI